jgi:hypothetical protein
MQRYATKTPFSIKTLDIQYNATTHYTMKQNEHSALRQKKARFKGLFSKIGPC